MTSQEYRVGCSTITVILDTIAKSKAEVIVSSDDCGLSMGGGVSAALMKAAGPDMVREANKIASARQPARVGDVVVTPAGRLPAKYLLHAVTLDWHDTAIPRHAIVRQATRKVMELLPLLRCRTVAFPAIGTGVAGIPPEEAASEMAAVLVAALLDCKEEYRVELYLLDRWGGTAHRQFIASFEAYLLKTLGLAATDSPSGRELKVAEAGGGAAPTDPQAERARMREIYAMLRHLDVRRDGIEGRLVDHATHDRPLSPKTVDDLKRQLAKIEEMRHGYEADLQIGPVPMSRPKPEAVFLSSTFVDLEKHRAKVREKVLGLGFAFIGMEDFPSWSQRPAEFIQLMVEKAQVYLGILGMRYGYIDPGTGLSMTELEYRRALAHGKPVHMFVMDDSAPITPAMVERDPSAYDKLIKLKGEVTSNYVCAFFRDESDLAEKVEVTLRAIRQA